MRAEFEAVDGPRAKVRSWYPWFHSVLALLSLAIVWINLFYLFDITDNLESAYDWLILGILVGIIAPLWFTLESVIHVFRMVWWHGRCGLVFSSLIVALLLWIPCLVRVASPGFSLHSYFQRHKEHFMRQVQSGAAAENIDRDGRTTMFFVGYPTLSWDSVVFAHVEDPSLRERMLKGEPVSFWSGQSRDWGHLEGSWFHTLR